MNTLQSEEVSPESCFLSMIFMLFNERGIHYAVMRNYSSLPHSAGGSDLDVIIFPEDRQSALNALNDAARLSQGVCIGHAVSPDLTKATFLGRASDTRLGWWGLRVDLCLGFCFAGLPLLAHGWDQIADRHRGIRILPDGLSGVLAVLKEVLNNGIFPQRYAGEARSALNSDWVRVRALLSPMGAPAVRLLERLLDVSCGVEQQSVLCRRLRRAVLVHALTRNPLQTLARLARFQCSKFFRYSKPSGLVLGVLGVDGAGKSTVIDAIRPVLSEATHNSLLVKHLRPGLLPALGRLKGSSAHGGPVTDPHGKNPSGTTLSLFRLMYLCVDYMLGYWLLIRPQISKLPNIVIFDRYAYDLAFDPLRFRIDLPQFVLKSFVRLAPRPDLVICLHGAAETIVQRKSELTLDETSRQIAALKAFAADNDAAVLVSTTQEVEETRDQVLGAIVARLQTRAKSAALCKK